MVTSPRASFCKAQREIGISRGFFMRPMVFIKFNLCIKQGRIHGEEAEGAAASLNIRKIKNFSWL